jgi:uncharacterized protein DUF1877
VGIELDLKHVSSLTLGTLLAGPAAAETFFLYPIAPRDDLVERLCRKYPADYARVEPHLNRIFAEWSTPALRLGKAWRWLAEGLVECSRLGTALSDAVLRGGAALGPDLGLGPVRYFTVEETRAHAMALAAGHEGCHVLLRPEVAQLYAAAERYYTEAAEAERAMLLCFG